MFRYGRCAIFSLWVGAGAVAFDAIADPMLISGSEDMLAVPIDGAPLLESVPRSAARPVVIDLPLPHPMPEWNQSRVDDGARARHDSSPPPENRRVAPFVTPAYDGSVLRKDDIWLRQLFRDYANATNSTGALPAGRERPRQGRTLDGRVESEFATSPEAMLRDAAVNVLRLMSATAGDEKEVLTVFVAQFGEFQAMFRTELRSLTDSVSGLWPFTAYEEAGLEPAVKGMTAAERHQAPSPGTMMLSGQSPVVPPPATGPIANMADFLIFILREFFTNPIAILATGGTLILWKSFELVLAAQGRRRRRGGSMPHRIRRRRTAKVHKLPSRA